MIHDPDLIDRLSQLPTEAPSNVLFRATRRNLDPTTSSTSGGRWGPPDGPAILYTCLHRDGAIAEIAFHWGNFEPRPNKPAVLHRLTIKSDTQLRFVRPDLSSLGLAPTLQTEPNYARTQQIGAAAHFVGIHGIIVPSARWKCDNLVLFTENISPNVDLMVEQSEEIDWQAWAKSAGLMA